MNPKQKQNAFSAINAIQKSLFPWGFFDFRGPLCFVAFFTHLIARWNWKLKMETVKSREEKTGDYLFVESLGTCFCIDMFAVRLLVMLSCAVQGAVSWVSDVVSGPRSADLRVVGVVLAGLGPVSCRMFLDLRVRAVLPLRDTRRLPLWTGLLARTLWTGPLRAGRLTGSWLLSRMTGPRLLLLLLLLLLLSRGTLLST